MLQSRVPCLFLFATCLAAGWAAGADFNAPVTIGAGLEAVDGAALAVDGTGEPCVLFSAGQKIYFAGGRDAFAAPRLVGSASAGAAQSCPSVDTDGSGVTYAAFREEGVAGVREVAWTSNPGGLFRSPVTVPESTSAGVEPPTIIVTPAGGLLIGWSVGAAGSGAGEIFLFDAMRADPPRRAATGSEASFAVDGEGLTHVAYVRGGDLYYSNDEDGDFAANEVRFTTTAGREFSPRLAVTSTGAPVVTYFSENNGVTALYLTDGSYRELLVANVSAPGCVAVTVDAGDVYHAAFVAPDGVWMQYGTLGVTRQRSKVCPVQGGEELVDIAVDASGYVQLVLVRAGVLQYANNAPRPAAAFTLSPTEGVLPLEVQFVDQSTGHVLRRTWNFGDGASSVEPEPTHTYQSRGTYTVSLRVMSAAGVSSEVVKTRVVSVLPKPNHMYLQDALVYAGQQHVLLPVKVTSVLPFQGFQIAGRFDANVMSLPPGESFMDFTSTVTGGLHKPEFMAARQNADEGWFTLGVVLEMAEPITAEFPPMRKMNLVNLVADFAADVPNRTDAKLRLEDDVGDRMIDNGLTVNGSVTVKPELHNGTVLVIRPDIESLGPPFLRGDADGNTRIDIADAIFVLQYLFAHGRPPACMDSGDVDDDGTVNIGDAIAILSYLFGNSFHPAVPFPKPGFDGTRDSLPACM